MILKKSTKRKLRASLGTYVIILFALSVMLYMFGFNNLWTAYNQQRIATAPGTEGQTITDPDISSQAGSGTSSGIFNNIMLLMIGIIGGLMATGIAVYLITSWFTKGQGSNPTQQTVNLIFPMIILIVVTNVFIFPIADIQSYMSGMDVGTFNISVVVVAFLNLWLILGIVEYVRGTQI